MMQKQRLIVWLCGTIMLLPIAGIGQLPGNGVIAERQFLRADSLFALVNRLAVEKMYRQATKMLRQMETDTLLLPHHRWEAKERFAELDRLKRNADPFAQPVSPIAWHGNRIPSVRYVVSPQGTVGNLGTEEAPFASLEQARDAIRDLKKKGGLPVGGVEVLLRDGIYSVDHTFMLENLDAGTPESPIVYRNYPGEKPVLSGGLRLSGNKTAPSFRLVDDASVLGRLPEAAKGKVMVADLRRYGVSEKIFPVAARGMQFNGPRASPWFEVYINGKPQQIARYPNYDPQHPNDCFMEIGAVVQGGRETPSQDRPGIFNYSDRRINRWVNEPDAWMFGYWTYLWAANSIPVKHIDTVKQIVEMANADYYGFKEKQVFYGFNLLSELDEPGEWYLDRELKLLYVYPPVDEQTHQPIDLNRSEVVLSILDKPLVSCADVSHVTFKGLGFADGATTAFLAEGGEHLIVADCTFERLGGWAISMENGKYNGVYGCNMQWLGGGGVWLSGGDIPTLEAGNCFVENCRISNFTLVDRVYAPAVQLDGVGNRIAHNVIRHAPHQGMRIEGYDQLIEYNVVDRVVQESDDQSGIDMFGNPLSRGNVIRYNFWSNIGNKWNVAGQAGIRLDDMISGVLMYGNVFYHSAGGRFGAVQIHGGKDNIADNNLIIDSKAMFSFNDWGRERWEKNLAPGSRHWEESATQAGVNPFVPPHSTRYPDLAKLKEHVDRSFLVRNISIGTPILAIRQPEAAVFVANRLLNPDSALGIDEVKGLFDSYLPQFLENTAFKPLPLRLMGNYPDSLLVRRAPN